MGMFDGVVDAISGVTSAIGGIVDPVQGLVSGGLSMLGGSNANNAAWDRQQSSQNFNAAQSQAQMDFQKQMRATQYQTSVQDLMAAGLNPMLAYTQGGAGTPSGASASSSPAPVHDTITPAVSAYMNAKQTGADLTLKAEQAKATNASAEQSRTQALANTAQALNQSEQAKMPAQQIANLQKTMDLLTAQINTTNTQALSNSANAALAKAQASNEANNLAKTADPWWYSKLKQGAKNVQNNFTNSPIFKDYQNWKKK
jgi:hypothetical protein